LNSTLLQSGVSGLAFVVIAAGAIGCFVGGMLTRNCGSARVAAIALALSGGCCFVFAFAWRLLPPVALLLLLVLWAASCGAYSPQFSALSARACPPDLVGAALSIQISIGFGITMVSIAVVTALFGRWGVDVARLLLPGPFLGLFAFSPLWMPAAAA